MTTLRKISVKGKLYDLGLSDSDYQKLSTLDTSVFVVVETLPLKPTTKNEGKIHIVTKGAKPSEGESNIFTEYVWVPEQKGDSSQTIAAHWEEIGSIDTATVDLSNYVTKDELYISFDGFVTEDYVLESMSTSLPREKLLVLFDKGIGTFIFKERASIRPKYYNSSTLLNDTYFQDGIIDKGVKTNVIYRVGKESYVFDKSASSLSEAYSKDRVITIKNITDLDNFSDIKKLRYGGIFAVKLTGAHVVGFLKVYLSGAGKQVLQQFDTTFVQLDTSPASMTSDFGKIHRWYRVYNGGTESAEGLPSQGKWSAWKEFKGEGGKEPTIDGETIIF